MEYLTILRLVHIVCAIFWAGSVMYLALFIMPAVRVLGPDGGKFMQQLSRTNGMPMVLTLAATLSIIAGLLLMYEISGGYSAGWFGTPHGIVLSIGMTFGIVAYLIGLFVNRPAVSRIAAIGKAIADKGGAPTSEQTAELNKLRTRLFSAINVTAVLVLGASVAMSIARYIF